MFATRYLRTVSTMTKFISFPKALKNDRKYVVLIKSGLESQLINRPGKFSALSRMLAINFSSNNKDESKSNATHKFESDLSDKIKMNSNISDDKNVTSESEQPDQKEQVNKESENSDKKELTQFDPDTYDDYDENYEPKTAKDKVLFYSHILLRLLMIVLGLACIFLFLREVFPGRMGPNSLFSEAFETLKINDDIREVTGSPMKAYGRDVGRNEGRRNHVDSRQYDEVDGSKRTRIRFTIEGPRGKIRVWAEISNNMPANEYVYLICQDLKTGRVITVVDNRDRLEAEFAAGGNEASKNAILSLLGGNSGSSPGTSK